MKTPPFWIHLGLLLLIPFAIYLKGEKTPPSAEPATHPEPFIAAPVTPPSLAVPAKDEQPVVKVPFAELTRETLRKLPTVEEIRRKQTDFHRPPPELSEGAAALSQIENRLREEPELVRDGMEFFRSCAADERVLSALRAVCLRSLQDWAKKAKLSHLVRREEFSQRLHYIADQLPSLR